MRHCGRCGASVSETAKFCEECGEHLGDVGAHGAVPSAVPGAQDTSKDVDVTPTPIDKHAEEKDADFEELDLTNLDKKAKGETGGGSDQAQKPSQAQTPGPEAKPPQDKPPEKAGNIIDIQDILESEEKVEADNSIKREVLADEEIFSKICPMCGEDMQISKQLLENTPVVVKCLKCGNETKIW